LKHQRLSWARGLLLLFVLLLELEIELLQQKVVAALAELAVALRSE
jgi:hypothetical protein